MSFKTIKNQLIASVYSRLMSAIRKAAVIFQSASVLLAGKNKTETKAGTLAETDDHAAPEHWLALLKRNNLTLLSFKKQPYRKSLPVSGVVGIARKKENREKYTKTNDETVSEIRSSEKLQRAALQNTTLDSSSQSAAYLTNNDVNNEEINPFKSKPLLINVDRDKAGSRKIVNNTPSVNSRFSAERKKRANNLKHSVDEKVNNAAADTQMIHESGQMGQVKESTDFHQADIKISCQRSEDNPEAVIGDEPEKMFKDKTGYRVAPLKIASSRFKNSKKTEDGSIYKETIKTVTQEKFTHSQDVVHPILSNKGNANEKSYFPIETQPVTHWQELLEDVWDESSCKNEFAIPPGIDAADIRKILWNG